MRMLGPVVVVASFACGTLATAQIPKAEAAAGVLAATREALGGEKKLAAVKTLVATGRTRQIRGENLVPIEFEIAMELPDRYVRKDEIPAQESGPTTVGFNGEELIQYPEPAAPTGPGRSGPPGPTPEQLDAARKTRLSNVRQDFARLTLGLFATSFTSMPLTFSFVGKAEAPQGKADVLDVKGPGNFSARFFVNADTHLPIMISWQAPTPPQRGRPPSRGDAPTASAGQAAAPPSRADAPPASTGQAPPGPPAPPPESRIYFADYRDVGGMQFPFRLRRALGPDTVEETTFDGFKINSKIDPKKFEVRK
jgi:hypothetical protein